MTLEISECAADGGPLIVEADANQLQQALVNLALNARDALNERLAKERGSGSPRAGHFRRPHCFPATPPGCHRGAAGIFAKRTAWRLCRAGGEGQRRRHGTDVFDQAFNPFFTTKDVGQGTGLGLPMVFGIVQGHQGFLAIDTAPGKGTCVRLYLPRSVRQDSEPLPSIDYDSQVVEPESQPGRSILVIDDEESVLDVVRRFLQIAGHRVTSATSGQEGADFLAQGKEIDLVILDLMMPREDAATTFQHLRQKRPGVPILLCTGLPEADPAPECCAGRTWG